MAEKGTDLAGNDQDNQLFIPLKTFLRDFVNQENVNIIYIQAVSAEAIEPLAILSIMILIVNERRGEIGIRRAVGSRKRDIILQFP